MKVAYVARLKGIPSKAHRFKLVATGLDLELLPQVPTKFETSRVEIELLAGQGLADSQLESQSLSLQQFRQGTAERHYKLYYQSGVYEFDLHVLNRTEPAEFTTSKRIMRFGEQQHSNLEHFLGQRAVLNRKRYITKKHKWEVKYRLVVQFANRRFQLWLGEKTSFTTFYDRQFIDPQDDVLTVSFDQLVYQEFNLTSKLVSFKQRTEEAVVETLAAGLRVQISKAMQGQNSACLSIPIFDRFSYSLGIQFEPMSSNFIGEFAGFLGVSLLESRTALEPVLAKIYIAQNPDVCWRIKPAKVYSFAGCYFSFWSEEYSVIYANNPVVEEGVYDPAKQVQNMMFSKQIKPILTPQLQFNGSGNSVLLSTFSPFNKLVLELWYKNTETAEFVFPCIQLQPLTWFNCGQGFLLFQADNYPQLAGEKWSIRDTSQNISRKAFSSILQKRKQLEPFQLKISKLSNFKELRAQKDLQLRVSVGPTCYRYRFRASSLTIKQAMGSKQFKPVVCEMRKSGTTQKVIQLDGQVIFLADLQSEIACLAIAKQVLEQSVFMNYCHLDCLTLELFLEGKEVGYAVSELGSLLLGGKTGRTIVSVRLKSLKNQLNPLIVRFDFKLLEAVQNKLNKLAIYQIGFKQLCLSKPYRAPLKLNIVRGDRQYSSLLDYSLPIRLATSMVDGAQFCVENGFSFTLQVLNDDSLLLNKTIFVNTRKSKDEERELTIGPNAYQTCQFFFTDPACSQNLSFYLYVNCRSSPFISDPLCQLCFYTSQSQEQLLKTQGLQDQQLKVILSKNKKCDLASKTVANFVQNEQRICSLTVAESFRFVSQKWYQILDLQLAGRVQTRYYKLPRIQVQSLPRHLKWADKVPVGFWTFVNCDGANLYFFLKETSLVGKTVTAKQSKQTDRSRNKKTAVSHKELGQARQQQNKPEKHRPLEGSRLQQCKVCHKGVSKFMGKCENCIHKVQSENIEKFYKQLYKLRAKLK